MLFPRGSLDPKCLRLYLYRDKDCYGAENIEVEYNIQLLQADCSDTGIPNVNKKFLKDMRDVYPDYIYRHLIPKTKVMKFLSQDSLTVNCKFFRFNGKIAEIPKIFLQTIISVE